MALPSGKRSRVKSIVTYDGELDEAFSPDGGHGHAGGRDRRQPRRHARASRRICRTCRRRSRRWSSGWRKSRSSPGKSYWIKQTTRMVAGEIAELRYGVDVNTLEKRPATQLAMNEVGHVLLSLNQPIAYDPYKINAATGAFILIDRLTNTTVGAGMILEPQRPRAAAGDHWGQRARQPAPQGPRTAQVTPAEREQRFGQKARHDPAHRPDRLRQGRHRLRPGEAPLRRRPGGHGALRPEHAAGPLPRPGLHAPTTARKTCRRSAEVAKILNDAGLICHLRLRRPARSRPAEGQAGDRPRPLRRGLPFRPASKSASSATRSGAYKLAEAGKIAAFPGVSAAFEEPTNADLVLPTHEIFGGGERGADRQAVERKRIDGPGRLSGFRSGGRGLTSCRLV